MDCNMRRIIDKTGCIMILVIGIVGMTIFTNEIVWNITHSSFSGIISTGIWTLALSPALYCVIKYS